VVTRTCAHLRRHRTASPKVFSPRWRALQLTELISAAPIYYGLLIYTYIYIYVHVRASGRAAARLRRHGRPKIRSWRIRASVYRIRSGFPCADTRATLCAFEQDVCSGARNAHVISIPAASLPPSLPPLYRVRIRAHLLQSRDKRAVNTQVAIYPLRGATISRNRRVSISPICSISRAAHKRARINEPALRDASICTRRSLGGPSGCDLQSDPATRGVNRRHFLA